MIDQVEESKTLGKLCRTFKLERRVIVTRAVLLSVLALALSVLVGMLANNFLAVLLAFVVLGLGVAAFLWVVAGRTILIYEHGLRQITRLGDREVCWNDVEEVALRIFRNPEDEKKIVIRRINLRSKNAPLLSLRRIGSKTMQLVWEIERRTSKNLFAHYMALLAVGQPMTFGKVVLDADQVTKGRKQIARSEIAKFRLNYGGGEDLALLRSDDKPLLLIDMLTLPNRHVFQEILPLWLKLAAPAASKAK